MKPRGCRESGVRVSVEEILPHCHRGTEADHRPYIGRRETVTRGAKAEYLEETPTGLVIEGVEDEGRLPGSRNPGDHGEPAADIHVYVLEVMLPRTANDYFLFLQRFYSGRFVRNQALEKLEQRGIWGLTPPSSFGKA